MPIPGYYAELLNSDGSQYGGSGMGNEGGKQNHDWDNRPMPSALPCRPWGCWCLS